MAMKGVLYTFPISLEQVTHNQMQFNGIKEPLSWYAVKLTNQTINQLTPFLFNPMKNMRGTTIV